MNTKKLHVHENGIVALTNDEVKMINGGYFWETTPHFLLIGAAAAAALAIYELGKATGDFIYHATH